MSLSRISIRDSQHITDDKSGIDVLHVFDPHALVQAAGYMKYINGSSAYESIYFRGQTNLYPSLSPALFRGCSGHLTQARRTHKLNAAIEQICNCKIFNTFSNLTFEPLLQHYGLRTSWIDLVDNIWVALWFACHTARATGRIGEYLHFERRNCINEHDGYAYILLIAVDAVEPAYKTPGVYHGATTELVDLRVACPSIFLRPHAQHGALFRVKGNSARRPVDYADKIRGVIRISICDALSWLGLGSMLDIHGLFPPPYYDHGYSILLESKFESHKDIGAITHIGA